VCDGLIAGVEEVLLKDGWYTVHFLIGGPGTGKTSILLQILRRLSSQVTENAETWRIGLRITDRVADYVTASTGWQSIARLFHAIGLVATAGRVYSPRAVLLAALPGAVLSRRGMGWAPGLRCGTDADSDAHG
jgi:hypothetical protein